MVKNLNFRKKEDRHIFYKSLLKQVCNDPDVRYGLCVAIHRNPFWRKSIFKSIAALKGKNSLLPEIAKHRPRSRYLYWFPTTYKGWEKRIAIIEQAIKETKP